MEWKRDNDDDGRMLAGLSGGGDERSWEGRVDERGGEGGGGGERLRDKKDGVSCDLREKGVMNRDQRGEEAGTGSEEEKTGEHSWGIRG